MSAGSKLSRIAREESMRETEKPRDTDRVRERHQGSRGCDEGKGQWVLGKKGSGRIGDGQRGEFPSLSLGGGAERNNPNV